MSNPKHAAVTVSKQLELTELSSARYYYKGKPMTPHNRFLCTMIDEEFSRHPFLGTGRMREYLISQGHTVNRKRVVNLYHELNLEAIFPRKNLSKPDPEHKKFPYLLQDVPITHANHL